VSCQKARRSIWIISGLGNNGEGTALGNMRVMGLDQSRNGMGMGIVMRFRFWTLSDRVRL
jgi:hypothetical protein